MTIQIIKATNKIYNGIYNELYNGVNINSVPYLIIHFSVFMILFGYTNITISAADNLSYPLLVILLFIVQILLYFFLHNQNQNRNHYKIHMILSSILISFALLYIIHIKRIYDEEMEIIIELKNKDIIEDINISCWKNE